MFSGAFITMLYASADIYVSRSIDVLGEQFRLTAIDRMESLLNKTILVCQMQFELEHQLIMKQGRVLEDLLSKPEYASDNEFHPLGWNNTLDIPMDSYKEAQEFADNFNGIFNGWAYYKPDYFGLSGGNKWTNKKIKSFGTFFDTSMK